MFVQMALTCLHVALHDVEVTGEEYATCESTGSMPTGTVHQMDYSSNFF